MSIHIPERFVTAIALHMMKNLVNMPSYNPPLILGIHGPSGEGKTFQTEIALRRMGVRAFLVSGGQFESEKAGEPGRMLRARYVEASQAIARKETAAAALVINDFDAGIGDWSRSNTRIVQYTVNSQVVNATLMNIADKPEEVAGEETHRVPIFVTGNNFSTLYKPLVRHGRMAKFEWKPAFEEKMQMIRSMFHPQMISDDDLRSLVQEFPSEPIDFFATLRDSVFDDQLLQLYNEIGVDRIVEYLTSRQYVGHIFLPQYTIQHLAELGKTIQRAEHLGDHLRARKDRRNARHPTC